MKDLILSLKAQGKTVLLCSHLLADVQDVCDRITILYAGKMQTLGQVKDLIQVKDITQIQARGLDEHKVREVQKFLAGIGRRRIDHYPSDHDSGRPLHACGAGEQRKRGGDATVSPARPYQSESFCVLRLLSAS